jgi:IS5 family transposase
LHAFNDRVTAIAAQVKVARGRKLRTDGTVVESNIHHLADNSLLADGVRVLSRTIKRAEDLLSGRADMTAEAFRDRTRSARNQSRRIADEVGKWGSEAKADLQAHYRRLVSTTKANVQQAKQVLGALKGQTSQRAKRLADTLGQFIPRVELVVEQTVRRVLDEQIVPAQEKIVSIFEPHTDIRVVVQLCK